MSTFRLMLNEIRFRWLHSLLALSAVVAAGVLLIGGPTLIAWNSQRMISLIELKEQELTAQLESQREQQAAELADKESQLQGKLTDLQTDQQAKIAALRSDTETLLAEMDKKTKRLMRDLGFNITIVHQDTDMANFYGEFKAEPMPESYVEQLGKDTSIDKVRHLVATLQQKTTWNDRTIMLVGILPSQTQDHLEKKPPMGYRIQPGTVFVGHELATGKEVGDTLAFGERKFEIAQILPQQGNQEDIMLAMHLHDAQAVLDMDGQITQIMALGCKCEIDRLAEIREQVQNVLKDTKVTEDRTKAIARAEQRELVAAKRAATLQQLETSGAAMLAQAKADHAALLAQQQQGDVKLNQQKQQHNAEIIAEKQAELKESKAMLAGLFRMAAPSVILICGAWIGLLAFSNVRERRPEIGVLRALGKGAGSIAALFLGKALLLGVVGGLVACGFGYLLAVSLGESTLQTAMPWLIATVVGAPIISAMATWLPTMLAVQQDPAVVLRDQ